MGLSQQYRVGCEMALNLGENADATGTEYGQLAGAYHGEKAIPQRWLSKLARKDTIVEIAGNLLTLFHLFIARVMFAVQAIIIITRRQLKNA